MAYRSNKHRVVTKASKVKRRRIPHSAIPKIREKLAKEQHNVCPVCERSLLKLIPTLDHCHKTGYLRGVLCNNCNGLEGKLSTIIARIDIANIGTDKILHNLAKHRHPSNLNKKYIHPNAETMVEARDRKRLRAKKLYQQRKKK